MARVFTVEIELLGRYAGADMVISGHQFVKGKTVISSAEEIRIEQAARLFSFYGGYVVGSPEWKARKELDNGVHDSEGGEEGSGSLSGNGNGGGDKPEAEAKSNGEGHDSDGAASAVSAGPAGSGNTSRFDPSQMKKLADAIRKLDPEVDTHWTDAGLPRLKALESAGFHGVTREAVEAAAPDWNREKAVANSL